MISGAPRNPLTPRRYPGRWAGLIGCKAHLPQLVGTDHAVLGSGLVQGFSGLVVIKVAVPICGLVVTHGMRTAKQVRARALFGQRLEPQCVLVHLEPGKLATVFLRKLEVPIFVVTGTGHSRL